MNNFQVRPWMGALIFLAVNVPAHAQETRPGPVITLREALLRAAEANPDLKALAYELRINEGRVEQAGLRPNPSLGLEVENVPGSGDYADGGSSELTIALSQVIELGDKRRLRVGVATAEGMLAESEISVRRLDVSAEVLRRFVRALGEQELLTVHRHRLELAERTLTAVEARVAAARSPAAELHRAKAARDRALLEQRAGESNLRVSLLRLSALWGETPSSISSVKADLYALPAVSDFETLTARTRESPEVMNLLTEARLRDAELRLAEAQRRPNLTLGAGIRRLEETDDVAMVFSVELPLTLYDRNQGNIRAAQAHREQADALLAAQLTRANADLSGYYQELLQSRQQMEFLKDQVLPELEEALTLTETVYKRGRYSYLELADAQRSVVETHAAIIESATRYHALLAEIERITGQPLALPAH